MLRLSWVDATGFTTGGVRPAPASVLTAMALHVHLLRTTARWSWDNFYQILWLEGFDTFQEVVVGYFIFSGNFLGHYAPRVFGSYVLQNAGDFDSWIFYLTSAAYSFFLLWLHGLYVCFRPPHGFKISWGSVPASRVVTCWSKITKVHETYRRSVEMCLGFYEASHLC